jgi:hypothetical protein
MYIAIARHQQIAAQRVKQSPSRTPTFLFSKRVYFSSRLLWILALAASNSSSETAAKLRKPEPVDPGVKAYIADIEAVATNVNPMPTKPSGVGTFAAYLLIIAAVAGWSAATSRRKPSSSAAEASVNPTTMAATEFRFSIALV